MLVAPVVGQGVSSARQAGPGDILGSGETIAALATAGAGTITAAMIAAGILNRTGPGGGYTDTTDTANAILLALAGNDPAMKIANGTTFRFIFRNTVAFAMTLAGGVGVLLGSSVNGTASLVREYLVSILNSTPAIILVANTTNANAIVTLQTPQPLGTITPGMLVVGTGITVGSRVAGVNIGDQTNRGGTDKIYTITLDQNGASVQTGVSLTFSPVVRFDGLREGTL